MKKNYLEPMIKVQAIALQSMMEASPMGVSEGRSDVGGEIRDRSDLLDDWN